MKRGARVAVMDTTAYAIPRSGPHREALRVKGQFWTPDWVAEAMVAYVVGGDCDTIFDPAVGAGAFFRAAKTLSGACLSCPPTSAMCTSPIRNGI